ncbi:YdcF family protein [Corynebacterium guangdongense]|uniref:Uncharacterized SAM-binding protein YcdF (DUF218 family) n=1 Tax=Corynebacterium guangdongense TaxID=1783348 RepID=A0ABU1ZUS3_9CORY|nr:YdcF family protein [Corynebacterium guangdongense]MDR7328680.1 uncharacterized SAM-binding protein YcdF (DUF218 family) [Corynebacterium guangdongense]WJZ17257.1 hypothetical protein CGUA_03305 [Corynebacterium guangdongense]
MAENILVLGARVIDGRPEPILQHRLRRALTLAEDLDRAGRRPTVVVSGHGEAEAMFDWLVRHGLDAGRILIEPDATSTNENLEKAHALVPGAGRWLVVTSDFHAWRTRLWAWHLGIPVTLVTAHTPLREGLGHWGRELLATSHSLLRVGWRKILG